MVNYNHAIWCLLGSDVTGGTEKHVKNQELSNEGTKVRYNPELLLGMYLCVMFKITAVRKLIWIMKVLKYFDYFEIFKDHHITVFSSQVSCENARTSNRLLELEI